MKPDKEMVQKALNYLKATASFDDTMLEAVCKEALRSIVEHYKGDSLKEKILDFSINLCCTNKDECVPVTTDYVDTMCIRDSAKALGVKLEEFVNFLIDGNYAYRSRVSGRLLAEQESIDKGYFIVKPNTGSQIKITKKGRDFFKSEI